MKIVFIVIADCISIEQLIKNNSNNKKQCNNNNRENNKLADLLNV